MEQKLVVFKKRHLFEKTSMGAINAEILELNKEGWKITSLSPVTDFLGGTQTYVAVCERKGKSQQEV